MATEITTGVGRIVWGNPAKAQPVKDPVTKQPKIGRDGQQVMQWAFGVAFPKEEFQQTIWPAMANEAATGYPNGVPQNFSWKYNDGDGVDSNGQLFANRTGYAGCFVLTVSNGFAPPIYKFENGAYRQIEADEIKTGDYVALGLNIKVNIPTERTHTPGLYVNPAAIELVGYGELISNGPDPNSVFGGQQRQLPPGASATPISGSNGVGMPGTGQPMQQPMGQQQPPMQPPMGQQQPPMQPPMGQQQPPMQPPMGQQQPAAAYGPATAYAASLYRGKCRHPRTILCRMPVNSPAHDMPGQAQPGMMPPNQ